MAKRAAGGAGKQPSKQPSKAAGKAAKDGAKGRGSPDLPNSAREKGANQGNVKAPKKGPKAPVRSKTRANRGARTGKTSDMAKDRDDDAPGPDNPNQTPMGPQTKGARKDKNKNTHKNKNSEAGGTRARTHTGVHEAGEHPATSTPTTPARRVFAVGGVYADRDNPHTHSNHTDDPPIRDKSHPHGTPTTTLPVRDKSHPHGTPTEVLPMPAVEFVSIPAGSIPLAARVEPSGAGFYAVPSVDGVDRGDELSVSVEGEASGGGKQAVPTILSRGKSGFDPVKAKRKLGLLPGYACSTCAIGPECPEFKEGFVCAYREAFKVFPTRDGDAVVELMAAVVSTNAERWGMATLAERVVNGGLVDPKVTSLSETVFSQSKALVDLQREMSRVSVTVRGSAGTLGAGQGGPGVLSKLFGGGGEAVAPPAALGSPIQGGRQSSGQGATTPINSQDGPGMGALEGVLEGVPEGVLMLHADPALPGADRVQAHPSDVRALALSRRP